MILCSWESFCSGFCVVFLSNGLWNKSIGVFRLYAQTALQIILDLTIQILSYFSSRCVQYYELNRLVF